jgi:hypothetical protein
MRLPYRINGAARGFGNRKKEKTRAASQCSLCGNLRQSGHAEKGRAPAGVVSFGSASVSVKPAM